MHAMHNNPLHDVGSWLCLAIPVTLSWPDAVELTECQTPQQRPDPSTQTYFALQAGVWHSVSNVEATGQNSIWDFVQWI